MPLDDPGDPASVEPISKLVALTLDSKVDHLAVNYKTLALSSILASTCKKSVTFLKKNSVVQYQPIGGENYAVFVDILANGWNLREMVENLEACGSQIVQAYAIIDKSSENSGWEESKGKFSFPINSLLSSKELYSI